MKIKGLLFLILILLPFIGRAASPEWQIDPSQSSLSFIATQNDAPVNGQFKHFSGEIVFDFNNYKNSTVHIVVDMSSIAADYAEVKDTLLTSDWFNAKQFPTAEFKSTDFNKIGDNNYQAQGNLTIRDKSLPITLTFTAEQPSADTAIFTGNTLLKRTLFGVGQGEWTSTEQVKDDVKVNFKVVTKKKS